MRPSVRAFRPARLTGLAILIASLAPPSLATSLANKRDAVLAAQAQRIVVGRCQRATAAWQGRALVTEVRITVDRTIKGPHEEEISVFVPGGVDLDREVPLTVTVPGAPSLAPGEAVLLFLSPLRGRRGFAVTGFGQGKRSVLTAADGAAAVKVGGALRSIDSADAWIRSHQVSGGNDDAR